MDIFAVSSRLALICFVALCSNSLAQTKTGRPASSQSNPTEIAGRWLQSMDKDKNGKISSDEATGLMKRYFDRNDTNKDKTLDEKELQALARRLERNRSNQRTAKSQPRQPVISTERILANAPKNILVEPDIAYRPGDSKAWRLDLFHPRSTSNKPRPGIVFVHGGGWSSGDKRAASFLNGAVEYAQKGYVTITVNYRLTGEAPFPACIEDVKCAVRWFRAHARKYNLDPKRIGAYGNSAGAHLVSILGLVEPDVGLEGDGPWQDQSSMVQAVAASATPTDFDLFGPAFNGGNRFGDKRWSVAELRKLSSPINHVTQDAPPFLLFHGTADRTVNVKHSDSFDAALKKLGSDVTYLRIDGAGHGVFNQHAKQTKPAMELFFDRTLITD